MRELQKEELTAVSGGLYHPPLHAWDQFGTDLYIGFGYTAGGDAAIFVAGGGYLTNGDSLMDLDAGDVTPFILQPGESVEDLLYWIVDNYQQEFSA